MREEREYIEYVTLIGHSGWNRCMMRHSDDIPTVRARGLQIQSSVRLRAREGARDSAELCVTNPMGCGLEVGDVARIVAQL